MRRVRRSRRGGGGGGGVFPTAAPTPAPIGWDISSAGGGGHVGLGHNEGGVRRSRRVRRVRRVRRGGWCSSDDPNCGI